ncbi:hypothetical protein J3R82DRAFT_11039 [Butyriboletus roseoflavus]|nr:hypothetical protein J3R82DRAFT_11039 [Butyriboletus roseoflavus]
MRVDKANLEETIRSLRAQDERSSSEIARLEETVQQLRNQFSDSQRVANRKEDSLNETIKLLSVQGVNSNNKIAHLEKTVQQLRTQHADSQHRGDSLVQILHIHEQKHQCEILYADGRIIN